MSAPPIGFMPTAPAAPVAPPSYDEAMRQPEPQPAPAVKGLPYPPAQPYAVQAPVAYAPMVQVVQPQSGFPHSGPPPVPGVFVSVGPNPSRMQCPHCHQQVTTHVHEEFQKSAHLAALILCLIGCMLCSCLPYLMSSFKDVQHHCPKCKGYIGTYRR